MKSIIINHTSAKWILITLRIILDLEALNDQKVWGTSEYHKVQGFVYDKLIANTGYKGIHNQRGYKFFCFSNIFPPSIVRAGQIRHLLISSPNAQLIQSIFSYIKESLIACQEIVNIGEQQYRIRDSGLIDTKVTGKRCVVRTSTPVSVRIPDRTYHLHNINEEDRKQKFLYWRSNLSHDIFLTLILNNMKSKYKEFHGVDIEGTESAIQSVELLKEVVIHLPIADYTLKIPASFWRFYFDNLDTNHWNFLKFALDTGIGERNSAGLGFLNAEEGVSTVQVAKA